MKKSLALFSILIIVCVLAATLSVKENRPVKIAEIAAEYAL